MSLEKTTGGQEAPLTQANDPRTPLQDQLQKATEIAINQKAQELPGELSKKHVNTGEINILSPEAEVHETLESERKLKGLGRLVGDYRKNLSEVMKKSHGLLKERGIPEALIQKAEEPIVNKRDEDVAKIRKFVVDDLSSQSTRSQVMKRTLEQEHIGSRFELLSSLIQAFPELGDFFDHDENARDVFYEVMMTSFKDNSEEYTKVSDDFLQLLQDFVDSKHLKPEEKFVQWMPLFDVLRSEILPLLCSKASTMSPEAFQGALGMKCNGAKQVKEFVAEIGGVDSLREKVLQGELLFVRFEDVITGDKNCLAWYPDFPVGHERPSSPNDKENISAIRRRLEQEMWDQVSVYSKNDVEKWLRELIKNEVVVMNTEVPVRQPDGKMQWTKAVMEIEGATGSGIEVKVYPQDGGLRFTEDAVDPNFIGTMKVREGGDGYEQFLTCITQALARAKYDFLQYHRETKMIEGQ
jgi:hypothetical protein